MNNDISHEIELYLLEVFNTLLEHEVRNSRRYKHPVSLVHISVEAEPDTPQTQHAAEMVAINALDVELRETDIPCRTGHEFLVLMPSTDESGARNACDRLEKSLNISDQTHDGTALQVTAFIGVASIGDDLTLSSTRILDAACQAMQYARDTRSRTTVMFSELK